jgi:hypothetical protein
MQELAKHEYLSCKPQTYGGVQKDSAGRKRKIIIPPTIFLLYM